MKLYSFSIAPNPKRVLVYLAEKGIDIPIVNVDLTKGENRTEEFLAKNPSGAVPLLELDDGTCYGESLAIIEYFEERHPDPPMLGETPEERLRVRCIERICEMGVLLPGIRYVLNSHPFFAQTIDQNADVGTNGKIGAGQGLGRIDGVIGENEFVAGDRPTIADCTLFAALSFPKAMQMELDLGPYPNVTRWLSAFSMRPSAQG